MASATTKQKQQMREHYERNRDHRIRRAAEWAAAHPEKRAAIQRRHRAANRDKSRARDLLNKAVSRGKIKRGSCEVCGAPNAEAHHEDYSKPLDVRWFCRPHHRQHEGGQ